jgi:hypothetical protein
MRVLLAFVALLSLCGCVADQSRYARPDAGLDREELSQQTRLHGTAGATVLRLFNAPSIAEKLDDATGDDAGLQVVAFYHVQIAPDAARPFELRTAGYIRELVEDGTQLSLFEFYDRQWTRLAVMGQNGDLYRVDSAGPFSLGRFHLEAAAMELYHPPGGYGFDSVAQDRARVRGWDPEVATAAPRARGVHHATHRAAPPVLVINRLGRVEAASLAARRTPERFYETEALRAARQEELRHGGFGRDEFYGGLEYRDGNPVDEHGRPLHRGALRD